MGATNTFFTDGNYGEAYPKSSDMTDSGSGIPFLTGGNLKDGKLSLDGASYITPEKHSKLTSGHLLEDDIVIAVRGSLGALGYVNTDNSGWNINSQLAILRTDKSELYGKFLIQYLLSWTGQNELLKRQTGSALKQLPIGAIKDVEVPITSIAEQEKIGEYFADLDHLITLHQRKYDKLTNVKKSMLEKMFPQNGSNAPEIRFKGFTEAWEQRKVREVTDRYDNLRIPVAASLRVAGTTPYYGANGIQDYVDGYTHDGEFILVAEDGANDLKNYPVKCVKGRIWVNNHAHVLQGKYDCADNQFLAYAISQADIESLLVGGGRAKLNAETLMGIDLLLPNKAEQIRIGKYLAQLDNLITLHQRKPVVVNSSSTMNALPNQHLYFQVLE